jgi:hypothetical protein
MSSVRQVIDKSAGRTTGTAINRALTFNTYIKDKGCPGTYAYAYLDGRENNEAIAILLTDPTVRDAFCQVSLDHQSLRHVLQSIFGNHKTGYIYTNDESVTASGLDEAVRRKLSELNIVGPVAEKVGIIYTELLLRQMANLPIIKPLQGYVRLYEFYNPIPVAKDLMGHASLYRYQEILDKMDFMIDVKNVRRLTLASFEARAAQKFERLADSLLQENYMHRYMRDAMILVRHRLNPRRDQVLLRGIYDNPDLLALAENITFVFCAFEMDLSEVPSTRAHEHATALAATHLMLKNSPKYQIAPLNELGEMYSHQRIIGARDAIKGVIINKNLVADVHTQATKFIANSASQTTFTQIVDKASESLLDSLMAGIDKKVDAQITADVLHKLYSDIATSLDEPIIVLHCCSEVELFHYAAALMRRVIIETDVDGKTEMKFLSDVNRQNIKTSIGTITGFGLFADPGEAIMTVPDHIGTVQVPPHVQGIPDSHRNSWFWGNPEEISQPLSTDVNYAIQLGGITRVLTLKVEEFLGLYNAQRTRITIPVPSQRVFNEFVEAINIFDKHLDMITSDTNIDKRAVKMSIGMLIDRITRHVYDTPMGNDLVDSLIYKLLNDPTISPEDRDAIESEFYMMKKKIQMQCWTAIELLHKTGLLSRERADLLRKILVATDVERHIATTMGVSRLL